MKTLQIITLQKENLIGLSFVIKKNGRLEICATVMINLINFKLFHKIYRSKFFFLKLNKHISNFLTI